MKTCPRCYNKVQDDVAHCPNCNFRVSHPQAEKLNNAASPPASTKKKPKRSEFIFIIGILGAFIVFLSLFSALQNGSISFPSSSRSSRTSSSSGASFGGSSGGGSQSGGAAEETKESEETEAAFEVGEERTIHGDTIYFAQRKETLQAVLDDSGQAETLIDESKLFLLSDGDIVAIIETDGNLAFVDVLTGAQENTAGYVDIRNL